MTVPESSSDEGFLGTCDYDIVIRGGRVLDGTGSPWSAADVAIKGGRCAKIGVIAALVPLVFVLTAAGSDAQPAADPDARAKRIERQLTAAERFQLLYGLVSIPQAVDAGARIPPELKAPKGSKITAGYVPGIPRLGIPDLVETDAGLGVANPGGLRPGDTATALPSSLALASTFNPDLAFAGGAMIGSEAHAKGFNVLLGGGLSLARDPRGGRNFENLGEDPLLAGVMAGAAIAGVQSQGVICTAKPFAVNDQETLRLTLDARMDEAALRESDLLAFEIAIERGVPGAVMCAYNKVNGAQACGSDFLLNRVLKGDWHYKGWVMSDWGAVHGVGDALAGLDQQSGEQGQPD